MALNDEQHEKLRRLLKVAVEGDHRASGFALDDAAKIVGVKFSKGYQYPEGMKAGSKTERISDEKLAILGRGGSPHLTA